MKTALNNTLPLSFKGKPVDVLIKQAASIQKLVNKDAKTLYAKMQPLEKDVVELGKGVEKVLKGETKSIKTELIKLHKIASDTGNNLFNRANEAWGEINLKASQELTAIHTNFNSTITAPLKRHLLPEDSLFNRFTNF